jgi:hypothetical protein
MQTKRKGQGEKKSSTKTTKAGVLRIKPGNFEILHVRVESTSPLIMESKIGFEFHLNKYNKSTDKQFEAGLVEQAAGGKTSQKKYVKTEEVLNQEMESLVYWFDKKKKIYGIPAAGFRKSMIEVVKDLDEVAGTQIKRNVWVLPDEGDLVKIVTKKPHYAKYDICKASGMVGAPLVKRRPIIDEWYADLRIRYNADVFSAEAILNILFRCGVSDGYGGKRIGKGYEYGGYQIASKPAPKAVKFSGVPTFKIKRAS